MPLVNRLQIPQDLGVAQPTHPAAQWDMFKMAGANAALVDLGLLPPEEMEKDAYAGLLKALPAIWGGVKAVGKGIGGAGKGLWGAGSKAVGRVADPIGRAGNWAVQRGGTAVGLKQPTIDKIRGLGTGMAREAVGFGLLSGGMNAAMAEPGQRGSAFLRGAASGALGGLAWRGAGNLATAGLKRGLGAAGANVGKIQAAADKPWMLGKGLSAGERLKGVGASALMGGVPLAAGLAASSYTPTFEGSHGAPRTQAQRYAPYAARLGGGMMGAYPSHPMGYGYNPNLPMPQ